jgi:phosphoribosylamine-glycine ligase
LTALANPHSRILLLGAGGREHALSWKLAQSPRVDKVFVAPGNGGTASSAKVENVAVPYGKDFADILAWAKENRVRHSAALNGQQRQSLM